VGARSVGKKNGMTLRPLAVIVASASLLGCAMTPSGAPVPVTTPAPGEVKPKDYKPSGEVFFTTVGGTGTSADWSDFRIVGPNVNMTRDAKGQWAGNLAGRNMILTVAPGRITGDGIDLYVTTKGTTLSVQGMFGQRQVWVTIKPNEIQGTTDSSRCSFDLSVAGPGVFTGGVGCGGMLTNSTLQLTGEAANLQAPVMPQLVLGLIAVLPY
jgi:hypothetical protein